MEMKYTLTIAVTSIACLLAIFHSCHGLECYQCHSTNFNDTDCEKLKDKKYVFNYENDADICIKRVVHRCDRNNPRDLTDRILDRFGCMQTELERIRKEMEQLKKEGDKIDFYFCKMDRCNDD